MMVWSLVFTFLAVHAAHQHRWTQFGGLTWAAVVGVGIGLLGMKWPSLYEKRGPETLAEVEHLTPRWMLKPKMRLAAFWVWLAWALFLTAGTVLSGVMQKWAEFSGLLWAAFWCWVRFVYVLNRRMPPEPPPSFL